MREYVPSHSPASARRKTHSATDLGMCACLPGRLGIYQALNPEASVLVIPDIGFASEADGSF